MSNAPNTSKKGFTLVELSISIVIIGLIVSGVVAGASLVQQAKVRSITTDIDKFKGAINTFYLKYDQLPGDLNNAVAYWGGTTANGNGNRLIEWSDEVYRSWQHLKLAELINDNMTGTHTADFAEVGVNIPASSISNAGYNLRTSSGFHSKQTLYIMVGVERPATWADISVVTTQDARSIDLKLDDGMPSTGNIRAVGGSDHASANGICEDFYNTPGSTYVLTNTGLTCRMIFDLPY